MLLFVINLTSQPLSSTDSLTLAYVLRILLTKSVLVENLLCSRP